TIRALSSLKASPRGVRHAASRALTCPACSREWHSASTSSAYLISTGEPGLAVPAWLPVVMERTPAASSIPCRATFISTGLITPPTQQRIFAHVTLRVGGAVVVAAAGWFPDGDAVADGEFLGA